MLLISLLQNLSDRINAMIGKVYKIDMSVEPKADPGSMKTKRRYSAGNWSEYTQDN